jgi:hypothetical protein
MIMKKLLLIIGTITLLISPLAAAEPSHPVSTPPSGDKDKGHVVSVPTGTQQGSSKTNEVIEKVLQPMLDEKFKDVKDPAQLPYFNTDTSIDCGKYKKTLGDDLTNMELTFKDLKEKKDKGDNGVLLKMQAVWGFRTIVSFIYDWAFTPKHCTEAFENENKERLDAFGDSLDKK